MHRRHPVRIDGRREMTLQTGTIDAGAVGHLRARLRGALLRPGEEGYEGACAAWNLNARQSPAVVVVAEDEEDVLFAVRFAGEAGLGVGVMATGHGVGTPADGGVLINTSRMRGVRVDAVLRTARVEAGALWKDVIPAAQEHGLATLAGSAPRSGGLPDEMTTAVPFMNVPPLPHLPEPLRGRSVIVVKGAYAGENQEDGEEMFRAVREGLGPPIIDTFGQVPVARMDRISMDPVDPMGVIQHAEVLFDLSPGAVEALVRVAGAGSGSPLTILEIRQLGGALSRATGQPNLL